MSELTAEKSESNISYKRVELLDRTVAFSSEVIKLYRKLVKDEVGKLLGQQLLRAVTAVGANVHEAQGGQSRNDFISKIAIAQKEAIESAYWLRLLILEQLSDTADLRALQQEAAELTRILSAILVSAKRNAKRNN